MSTPSRKGAHTGLPPLDDALLSENAFAATVARFHAIGQETQQELARLHLPPADLLPDAMPAFPAIDYVELSKKGMAGYEEAYQQLLHWQGYLATLQVECLNRHARTKEALKSVKASLMKEYRKTTGMSQADCDNAVEAHPQVTQLTLELLRAQEIRNHVDAYAGRIMEQLKAVSRHVTIEGNERLFSPTRTSPTYSSSLPLPRDR